MTTTPPSRTDIAERRMEGQVAVVTGAAGGIGEATARELARRGVSILCADRTHAGISDVVASIVEEGGRAVGCPGDVTDPEFAGRARDACLAEFGRIDILVNNAGAGSEQVPLWEVDVETFQRILDVNLVSQFRMIRVIVPVMLEAGYGRIVNVASAAGMEGHALAGPYAAAKAGVIAMTKSLGKELARRGVIANSIAPALIESSMLAQPWFSGAVKRDLLDRIPMGRAGTPDEVAAMIGFLSSPAVSFSTGAVFDLSGGRATY